MIKYERDDEIKKKIIEIVNKLNLEHIKLEKIECVRSYGSEARRTLARCHALSRIWQEALGTKAIYVIEVLAEEYDKLTEKEKIETLIHELLHIPKAFGGGFKHHSQFGSKVKRLSEKYFRYGGERFL